MRSLWQDLKYGIRLLLRDGGFTFACVVTLALGIGANTAIFSVISGVLLHPLPYPDPERLCFLSEASDQIPDMSFSAENFKDLRDQSRLFDSFVAYNGNDYVMTGEGDAERVGGRQVTSGLFRTLGVQPIVGRPFIADEDKRGAERVVLLGEAFWKRRFGGRSDVVGKRLVLDGESYAVIGVMPSTMHGSWKRSDLFTPLLNQEPGVGVSSPRADHSGIYVIGRLKPGVSVEQGRAEAVSIARGLAEKYPDTNAGQSMTLVGLQEAIVGDVRPSLVVLFGAVGFVLLIACANVANLILGRSASRRREMAVRAAMGASRARVVRQLLTESVLLSVIGGGLGLLLAYWGVAGLLALIATSLPRVEEIGVDGGVLLFTALLSILTGLLFGLAPAWKISRIEPNAVLKVGGRSGSAGKGESRLRGALVVAEVSLALVLLVGAGLMVRSFYRVLHADPGIRPEGVSVAQVSLSGEAYRKPERVRLFIEQALLNARAIPGVAVASTTPLLGHWQTAFRIAGRPEPPMGQYPATDITRVSPGYFRIMGVDLVKGRLLDDHDGATAPGVCVVDETFARASWPDESPLGRKVILGAPHDKNARTVEVVGVVRHVKNYGVDQPSRVETYVPYMQDPIGFFTIVFRADPDRAGLFDAVRMAVAGVDPAVPIYATGGLESVVEGTRSSRRLAVTLLSIFAGLALLLAAVGIYGVISYSVSQRTQEIGIRMALGAERRQILRMVLGQGTTMAMIGVLVGLGISLALTRLMGTMLFQVSATDPPTFSIVPALLLAVATAAAWLPARRATRVDPMNALRDE
jgi:putative ABC transport system permease protein